MCNCSQNCWIDWNSAVLCFKRLLHIGVYMATILCVGEIWSGSNNRVYMYHVFHRLPTNHVTAPILKPTYDRKPPRRFLCLNVKMYSDLFVYTLTKMANSFQLCLIGVSVDGAKTQRSIFTHPPDLHVHDVGMPGGRIWWCILPLKCLLCSIPNWGYNLDNNYVVRNHMHVLMV